MEIEKYSALARSTASKSGVDNYDVLHAALGIGGEGGEITDHIKKVIFNNKPMDRDHLIAEAGDVIWYLNLLICSLDTTWSHVLETNIAKLESRYPGLRYSDERANNRDVAKEKAAMAAVANGQA